MEKIKKFIKNKIKRLIYQNRCSGEAYINYCKAGGATIGNGVTVYNARNTVIDETSLQHIFIGDNTQITAGVTILAHDYSYSVLGNVYGELPRQQRDTFIGRNVFIGMNSTILMGAEIGDNVIIGAGSVVTGRVPPNSVCAGNPAHVICSLERFLEKSRERFEDSARCYYNGVKRKKGFVTEKDMIVYKALFSGAQEMHQFRKEENFCGLDDRTEISMESYRKYESFDDFSEEM